MKEAERNMNKNELVLVTWWGVDRTHIIAPDQGEPHFFYKGPPESTYWALYAVQSSLQLLSSAPEALKQPYTICTEVSGCVPIQLYLRSTSELQLNCRLTIIETTQD